MKMLKKAFVLMLLIAPLLAVPKQSKAGGIGDIISALFGDDNDNKDKDKDKKPDPDGNHVPFNSGLFILVIAGAGLGAWMIYDRRKAVKEVTA